MFKNFFLRVYMYLSRRGFLFWVPDEKYLKNVFKLRMGRDLDLEDPKTFNEKLQWLKLYNRQPEYTNMVDKIAAKQFVANRIGEEYIIPTIGIWTSVDDIDFDQLPDQFVLKCNHDSGGLAICKDKSRFDFKKTKRKLKIALKNNGYGYGREWPYKDVKPMILAETFMQQPGKKELMDYKVLCFNGRAKLIELHMGRYSGEHTQDFYDISWEKTNIAQGSPLSKGVAPRPACLEQMIQLSELLSVNIPHLRVDWYEINGQLYFGELTFFDGSGFGAFDRIEDDLLLGSWIDLKQVRKTK